MSYRMDEISEQLYILMLFFAEGNTVIKKMKSEKKRARSALNQ